MRLPTMPFFAPSSLRAGAFGVGGAVRQRVATKTSQLSQCVRNSACWVYSPNLILSFLLFSGCAHRATAQRERDAFLLKLYQMERDEILHPTFYTPGTIRDMQHWVKERSERRLGRAINWSDTPENLSQ